VRNEDDSAAFVFLFALPDKTQSSPAHHVHGLHAHPAMRRIATVSIPDEFVIFIGLKFQLSKVPFTKYRSSSQSPQVERSHQEKPGFYGSQEIRSNDHYLATEQLSSP